MVATCRCGEQRQVPTADGCCLQCDVPCRAERRMCQKLTCDNRNFIFPADSCCPTCGCRYEGELYAQGPFGNKCDACVCDNGLVTCSPTPCPRPALQCVDPVRNETTCTYGCPNGKTCTDGERVIRYGQTIDTGDKLCTCLGEWFPNAFCAAKALPCTVTKLQAEACVGEPVI
ncbi:kielin/chordin-like protein [Dreissena polymorpha]|uniref:kielin/chordin-like protein n=1 Tax=Dreissena polymorpha TaxID=45954 RepID=UPI0022652FC9|nr:kielin/chordin-like protein [Dreissena polymorpha]